MMNQLTRITLNPEVMGGKPCIRGLRVTVGTIVGLMASGHTPEKILQAYPYLELPDIYEALAYAAWRAEEIEVPLKLAEVIIELITIDQTRVRVRILPIGTNEMTLKDEA